MSKIDWVHKDSTTIKEVKDIEIQTRVIDNSKDHIIEKLQQENKQLKEEKPYLYTNTEWEDILEYQGKSYIELDRFKTIQQENKQLKECYCNRTDCIGRIKDSKKYDSVKQQLDKATNILTELEEWLNEEELKYNAIANATLFSRESMIDNGGRLDFCRKSLGKIQELKEKYK